VGSNELLLRMGVEASGVAAGAEEAVEQVKSAQQDLSASTARAAQEDADHLALVEAQYGQLGPAAAKAYGQATAAADAAGAASVAASKKATGSWRGFEVAAANAAGAVNRLEKEIEDLRAAGGNVTVLENRLEGLRAEAQRNSKAFGEFRKNLRDVQDETKIAQRNAGEYEGTLTSLEDVVNSVNPALGNQVVKLLAVQSAMFIVQNIGRDMAAGMRDIAVAIGVSDEAADKFAKNLEAKFSANPFKVFASYLSEAQDKQAAFFENLSERMAAQVDETERASGALAQYALNLRNVLSGQGYDVAAASLEQLLVMEGEFRKRIAERGPAIEKLATQIRGDQKALQDDTAVTVGALAKLGDAELQNAEKAKKSAEVVRELVQRYKEAGIEVPGVLEDWNTRLQALVQSHENLATILDKVLSAVGVRGPAAIDKQIDALREYAGEVERSGNVTTDQAALILNSIEQIRRAIELLPEGQRQAAQGMLDALEDLEERYRGIAKVALATFGIQTPEAIGRSIEKVEGLISAFGPLGRVTAEQAAVVVAELQKILDAISVLPTEQRAAMADQEAAIRALADQYGEIAVRRKQYAEDIIASEEKQLAREKEILAERQELLSTFASVFDQLQAKLASRSDVAPGVDADVEKLRAELKQLQDIPLKSGEQVAQIAALEDELKKAAGTTLGFADAQKAATLTSQEVDDALAGLIDSIKGVEGGFANLPLAARYAVENMVGRLQQAAQEGTATKDVLNDAFVTVGRIIDEAGGSMGDLGTAINRANEDTLNLRREFGELEMGIAKAETAAKVLGETQKDAATISRERAEAAVKAANEEAAAVNVAKEAHAGVVVFLKEEVDLSARLLVIWKELKECMASASF
jgi:Mg2+ and Co2+ transporter CorA